ncbi:hypothetical protein [Bartonella sp. CB178]|uniref:hypothetical protein n=1 Tax=Bartonella sp. CB178 TaxID=3112255 RepID=UPI00300DC992
MKHKKLPICASTTTTVSSFGSAAVIGNEGVRVLSHFPGPYASSGESGYRSQTYKLWQYLLENKPLYLLEDGLFVSGGATVRFANEGCFCLQQISFLCQLCFQEVKLGKSFACFFFVSPKGWLSFRCNLFFFCLDGCSVSLRAVFGFFLLFLHFCVDPRALSCICGVFGSDGFCVYGKRIFRRNGFVLRVGSSDTTLQYLVNWSGVGVCVGGLVHHKGMRR